MLDIKYLRENPQKAQEQLQTKESAITLSSILSIDKEIRELLTKEEQLKAKKNSASKIIAQKKKEQTDTSSLLADMKQISKEISQYRSTLVSLEEQRKEQLLYLPNLPMEDVPISQDPAENVCIKTVGEKRNFSFPFKNHLELNEKLHLFDFAKSAKMSGTGWPLYRDKGAQLEWALINYMIDTHRNNGFTQIMPPLLVREEMMQGVGQLPKFYEQLFKVRDDDYLLYLIPTAEAPLHSIHYEDILPADRLPIKYVSYTPCFRREAGAAGKKERGLIRTHQFNKVELFCVTTPEESSSIFEELLLSAEKILQGLNLHYRNMLLVTADMSFSAAKTVDIEVFLPGQDRYYEVSSASNCTDFQARRAKVRYKKEQEKPVFVHTLNASGVATSRLMVALLENNQQEDGSILIPEVLHKYLPGWKVLSP